MRALVTGATGFIGRWIVPALVDRGCEVIALSSRMQTTTSQGVTWQMADLLDPSVIDNVVAKAQANTLIHTAWDTTPGTYWTTTKNLDWVSSSLKLFQSFRQSGGSRIVVAGTSAEYKWGGEADLVEGVDECPDTLYGTAKDSLRRIFKEWAALNDVSWAWGRVFCPFGEYERIERLIPKLIGRLRVDEDLPFDNGGLIRDFIGVRDLGDAFAAIATSNIRGPINVASGQGTSIREIVSILAQNMNRMGRVQFGMLPDPIGQPHRIVANVRRLREELDWKPATTLQQRLNETCDWWRAQIPT